jgi:hypothetical protein
MYLAIFLVIVLEVFHRRYVSWYDVWGIIGVPGNSQLSFFWASALQWGRGHSYRSPTPSIQRILKTVYPPDTHVS